VRGDVHLPAGKGRLPVVVICHGFKGFRNWGFFPWVAERLAAAGFAAIRFDFSLNGIGEDGQTFDRLDLFTRNTVTRELGDLQRVLAAVRGGELGDRLDPGRISLLGHSLGGGVSLLGALEDPSVHAVATWASVAHFFHGTDAGLWKRQGHLDFLNARTGQIMRLDYEVFEDLQANAARYDLLTRLPALRIPVLLVHGSHDASVGPEASESLARSLEGRGTLHILPGAGHTFGAVHPFGEPTPELEEAFRVTLRFLQKHASARTHPPSPPASGRGSAAQRP